MSRTMFAICVRGAEPTTAAKTLILALTAFAITWLPQLAACARAASEPPAVSSSKPGLPVLKVVKVLPTPGRTAGVIWSSDGTKLAAYSYASGGGLPGFYVPSPFANLITVWNADGRVFREIRRQRPFLETLDNFAFVNENKQIAAPPSIDSSDLAFSVFDVDTGEIVHEVDGTNPNRARNVNAATTLAASPDQSVLAVTFGRALAQPVALYSARDWSKLADLPNGPRNGAERPSTLAFSTDGKFLAVGRSDRIILIYDVNTRQVVLSIDAFPDLLGGASAIAFSPNGSLIAVGTRGFSDYPNPVQLFGTKDALRVAVYPKPVNPLDDLKWSPDGRFIAFITGHRTLRLWDPFRPETRERTIDLRDGATDRVP